MPTRSLFKSIDFQVAASETARAINRRIVLNLIRTHQPIFELTLRAIQSAKENGFGNRRTAKETWITEGAYTLRRRRPRFLHGSVTHTSALSFPQGTLSSDLFLADAVRSFAI
jgi:hypothetical protein